MAFSFELLRRVEKFSGDIVLAYAIMSNHSHIFIYVPEPGGISDDEILCRINAIYRAVLLSQMLGRWKRLEDEESDLLKRVCPTKKYVWRFTRYRRSFLRRMLCNNKDPFCPLRRDEASGLSIFTDESLRSAV